MINNCRLIFFYLEKRKNKKETNMLLEYNRRQDNGIREHN